jgi:hypothetical protein
MPLRMSSRERTSGWLTKGIGSSDTASRIAPTRKRRAGDARQAIAPVTAPASSDPSAHAIKITPAKGRTPDSFANATTTTSMPPNTMPIAALAIATGSKTSQGNRLSATWPREADRTGG